MGGGKSGKAQTIGYRYYAGIHMVLCHSPIDYIFEINVDDKNAYAGTKINNVYTTGLTSGQYSMSQENLFGGTSREGGLSGIYDVLNGENTQTQNSYLSSILGTLVPSFRGVLSVILNQFYLGINPYLKEWSFYCKRIHTRQNGIEQWYDEKSTVGNTKTYLFDNVIEYNEIWPALPGDEGYGQSIYPNILIIGPFECDCIVKCGAANGIGDSTADDLFLLNGNMAAEYIRNYPLSSLIPGGTELITLAKGETFTIQIQNTIGYSAGGTLIFTAFLHDCIGNVDNLDMNPAHILRECLTDSKWGMGYNEYDINDDSFIYAADTLFDEGMGISILWDTQTSIEDFVSLICQHINASIFIERTTGKFVLKLIRNDYDIESLIELNPSNVSSITDFTQAQFGELINSVTVTYWNRETRDNSTITAQDIALTAMQGTSINSSVKYEGFTDSELVAKVAQRDLKTLSTPLKYCTVYANRIAKNLNIGDCFKLTWPDYGLSSTVMRVTTIAYGDGKSNRIMITCVEDIFAMPSKSFFAPIITETDSNNIPPVPIVNQLVFEVPYIEAVQKYGQLNVDNELTVNPLSGYVGIAADRPSSNSINCRAYTDDGSGYKDKGNLDFCPFAVLAEDINETVESFTVSSANDFSELIENTWFQIDDEILLFVSLSDLTLTVKRGLFDTVPTKHYADDTLFFWELYNDVDSSEYVTGEEINVKLLTSTGSGVLDIADATESSLTIQNRMIRPYPPGNLQINGEYFPDIVSADNLILTWAHRDRKQQTSGVYFDFKSIDIGPEYNQSYNLRFYDKNDVLIDSYNTFTNSYEWNNEGTYTIYNPIHHYTFDNVNTGTLTINDEISGGTNLAYTSGKTFPLGWDGNCLSGGSTSYNAHSAAPIPFKTIHLWFKRPTTTNYTNILSKTSSLLILVEAGGTGRLYFFNAGGQYSNLTLTDTTEWHSLCIVQGSDNNHHWLWLDGVKGSTEINSNWAGVFQYIGRPDTASGQEQAFIDNIQIYDKILSNEEILSLFNATLQTTFAKTYTPGTNGKIRIELESTRDGYTSYKMYNITVYRYGYGFNYGLKYGGIS